MKLAARLGAFTVTFVLAVCTHVGAEQALGLPEVQANTYTAYDQIVADVAHGDAGEFLVVWASSHDQDGDNTGVFAQRFDSVSARLGTEFQVNAYTTGMQGGTGQATDLRGVEVSYHPLSGFVVVWDGRGAGDDRGIFLRRFDASGSPLGGDVAVNTYATGDQLAPVISHDSLGGFVVAWEGATTALTDGDVLARRFDSASSALGSEFLVNTSTVGSQGSAALSHEPTGAFVIAWQNGGVIAGQRFDATGAAVGTEFNVTSGTVASLSPRVAHDAAGDFVVVWSQWYGSLQYTPVFGGRYDSTGAPLDSPFLVEPQGSWLSMGAPADVAFTADGDIIVATMSYFDYQTEFTGIRLHSLNPDGSVKDPPFRVSDDVRNRTRRPRLSGDAQDRFVVAWQGEPIAYSVPPPVDTFDTSIRVARFCDRDNPACDLCPGFDDAIDDDADGIPNGCDPCTNVAGVRDMLDGAKLIARDEVESLLKVSGKALLADASEFALLDPSVTGARIRYEAEAGGAHFDVILPPGIYDGIIGWRGRLGRQWTFLDKRDDPPYGIRRLTMAHKSQPPGLVAVKVVASSEQPGYMTSIGLPYQATIVLGGQGDADAGRCVQTAFGPGDCQGDYYGVFGWQVKCR